MEASVIISYYKNLPNLELVLLALQQQSAIGSFEVIIAEDDNTIKTIEFLYKKNHSFSFPVKHVSQPDDGFQKCKILNKALVTAEADFIIFLDGDCIPHPQLVKQYILNKKKAGALYGRRVMLGEKFSFKLLQTKNLSSLNFFSMLFSGCKRVEEGLYMPLIAGLFKGKQSARLLGCNMGISKEALIAINGFDEDYTAPGGGEDSDIEWRLEGLHKISFAPMKFKAIVYHIWHQERFTEEAGVKSYEALLAKMKQGSFICKNGIKKLL